MAEKAKKSSKLTPTRAENFPEWYQAVVKAADLAEMKHVRGCMVIRPWGLGMWEQIRRRFDEVIGELGVENVYFPLFIPLSYIQKEADHVAGFAKEMAVVTHHRLELDEAGQLVPAAPLNEPVVVRPTSETIIGESMKGWIDSYRDLPMLLNQWANVVRWEMRPRVFLRTTEFLWQEGHTAHETEAGALAESLQMHEVYRELAATWLAIPVIPGEKPASERFPGAERSFTIEAMMQDGKAVQAGTSHFLGQNFAKSADIAFSDRDGGRSLVWTTSWGISTRLVGAVVMVHGDDDGLRVPPLVAPSQVVLVPIARGGEDDARVLEACREMKRELETRSMKPGVTLRVRVDARDRRSVDRRWEWVRKGAPVVIEVGARDLDQGTVSAIRRDDLENRVEISIGDLSAALPALLEDIQASLLAQATTDLERRIRYDVVDLAGFEAHFEEPDAAFVVAPWCSSPECETVAADRWSVSIRCIPFDRAGEAGPCVICGVAGESAVWGRSY